LTGRRISGLSGCAVVTPVSEAVIALARFAAAYDVVAAFAAALGDFAVVAIVIAIV
jgi:hypothetical protein